MPDSTTQKPQDLEQATRERYAEASQRVEPALCCAVNSYPTELLAKIPERIKSVDYGCGDPTQWAKLGDTVIDLGSGSGKHCYMLSQMVGETGHVIGVDFNPPMLELARSATEEFEKNTGLANVEFRNGRIQDLALSLDAVEKFLGDHPATDAESLGALEAEMARLRRDEPLIESDSVDLIVSNCVLNLARDEEKPALFREMHRVLSRGGRCVISDIVSDEEVPAHLKADPDLWSGCISGAMTETGFLEAFEAAGFHDIEILEFASEPWQVVEGIEFRSMTVRAFKGKAGPCLDKGQAVIYKGPWLQVLDDDGHTYVRGERIAVCEKTFEIMTKGAHRDEIVAIEPSVKIKCEDAKEFDCSEDHLRTPSETKGWGKKDDSDCCSSDGCC